MLAVEPGSRYVGLPCACCHRPIEPGDRILPSYRGGALHVVHAGACLPLARVPAG